MSLDPEMIYNSVLAAGEDWADKKSAYEALDDNTASVLADLMSNYMDGSVSHAEAKVRAQANKAFKDHMASVKSARKEFLTAQVKYDSLKMLAELRRSQESTRRQEMRL